MYNLSAFPTELKKKITSVLGKAVVTPAIICSKEQIAYNLHYFINCLQIKTQQLYFPVKVNHETAVLAFLNEQGVCFEISSAGELELLKNIHVSPEKIIFSNPVKIPEHIRKAYEYGVNIFVVDSESELIKLWHCAPASDVYLRIAVPNKGAEWKLEHKFGAKPREALSLLKSAISAGLKPCGISFHVGWNNTYPEAYLAAIRISERVTALLAKNDIRLDFLNIGGGFPAHGVDQYALLNDISKKMKPQLAIFRIKHGMTITAEPGSVIMANTAVMLTAVTAVIKRGKKRWIFLDSSIFQGFQWIMGGLKYQLVYPYKTATELPLQPYSITGATCDSHDIFAENLMLPETVKAGDFFLVYPAGAYISSVKEYNGYGYPETLFG
ncbi:MAG TPA: hypothetical protein PKW80_14930 [Bacteroidales bacterium]|nr:hypothetical protein [Bacteroidales bacterium]